MGIEFTIPVPLEQAPEVLREAARLTGVSVFTFNAYQMRLSYRLMRADCTLLPDQLAPKRKTVANIDDPLVMYGPSTTRRWDNLIDTCKRLAQAATFHPEEPTEPPTSAVDGVERLERLVQEVSVEEINSFQKASEVSASEVSDLIPLQLSEADIKRMLREIIDEPFDQKDWGGETSDLFTTRVVFRERRTSSAFLLKGPSVKGPMYIANLGKRGDQGQRLFQEPASLYVVQHVDRIASAVREHIQRLANEKAQESKASVYYCFIDGVDLARLLVAYGKIQAAEDSGN